MMGLKSQAIAPPSKGRGVQLGLILVALAWEPTGIAQLYIYISAKNPCLSIRHLLSDFHIFIPRILFFYGFRTPEQL